jgi:hypothetical protein
MTRQRILDQVVESYSRGHVSFEQLRPHTVRDILLVASLYDSYTLAEDGRLTERIFGAFHDLSLSGPAYLTRVATAEDALELLRARRFDVVITMARVGDLSVQEFGEKAKRMHPGLPVYLMTYDTRELGFFEGKSPSVRGIDKIFVWRGDVRLFLAVIKLTEDRLNVEHDVAVGEVRTVILVEDSIPFYSSYLPMLFDEIMKQTASFIQEGVNVTQKLLRMRARPKILHATTYEEAWSMFQDFREVVLGVLSDVRFPRGGKVDPEAGVELCRNIRAVDPYAPLVLQSSEERFRDVARSLGASFLHKKSPTLLQEFREFMLDHMGFGDFVFRMPDGTEVGRAGDIASMVQALDHVPAESLRFHGQLNHFSNWLMARTEFAAAAAMRYKRVHDFATVEEMREFLKDTLLAYRQRTRRGLVEDFDPARFDAGSHFVRIGGGSLGGKGRGLAFTHELLTRYEIEGHFPGLRLVVPSTAVLGIDVFDRFLERNDLASFALHEEDDRELTRRFLAGALPEEVEEALATFLERVRYPLAVRSSSLLEDSHLQPFAGVYATVMLPNTHPDHGVRRRELLDAIKFIYASTYFRAAKAYIASTPNRMEEEKMAVVVQRIVGRRCDRYVYPHVSGVAASVNYYPVHPLRPEDGIASVALGLGKTVVEGGRTLRFAPARPESLPWFSTAADMLKNAQRSFWALDLAAPVDFTRPESNLVRLDLDVAERHGMLGPVASTYSRQNDAVVDGLSREGVRLVTCAPLLKGHLGPFAEPIQLLLDLGARGLSGPVEIEFAMNLEPEPRGPREFAFLQIRPLPVVDTGEDRGLVGFDPADVLVRSSNALGHGRIADVRDVVSVRRDVFQRERTIEVAAEVGRMNERLVAEGRPYLLIGPGRWGTSDRWLGIPVTWAQISGARVILEGDLADVAVEPSQGTHFFQNMTSYGVGYFHVHEREGGFLDEGWLEERPAAAETRWLRHVRLEEPLEVLIDGRRREGVILKRAWQPA